MTASLLSHAGDGVGVFQDGSPLCPRCGNHLLTLEAAITLNGEPVSCLFADTDAGIVIVKEPFKGQGLYSTRSYLKVLQGDVRITANCLVCQSQEKSE